MNHMGISLENMSQAAWYNRWTLQKISKFLKGDILEIGCGTGNFTQSLTNFGKIWAIDIDQEFIKQTRKRVSNDVQINIGDIENGRYFFKNKKFDSIICFNVLEHIEDDIKALNNLYQLLKYDGKLILLVPAHPALFGSIDKAVGHFRRYQKNQLLKTLEKHNFKIICSKNLNFLGALGWWFAGKVLRNKSVDEKKLSFFNKIAPYILPIEDIINIPLGTSILVIARKS